MSKKHNSKVIKAAYESLFEALEELHDIIKEKKKEVQPQPTIEVK